MILVLGSRIDDEHCGFEIIVGESVLVWMPITGFA